ncbi:MAG: hypothetical protein D6732_26435 [Methanobacteriota archaeon]|nr:MAG: hypothetical protein D6732_26435 [Euryarchaeota archaeon]
MKDQRSKKGKVKGKGKGKMEKGKGYKVKQYYVSRFTFHASRNTKHAPPEGKRKKVKGKPILHFTFNASRFTIHVSRNTHHATPSNCTNAEWSQKGLLPVPLLQVGIRLVIGDN